MSEHSPIPLPPDEYMALVCGAVPAAELTEWFEEIGKILVDLLDKQKMLGEGVRLLDIGCGCGRVARHLTGRPLASYVGFDRHRGMVEWCRDEITGRFAKFQFLHCDVRSVYDPMDGQVGAIPGETFSFPFADGAFDSMLLASVFTHMPLLEIENYLKEMRRTLHPDGAALATVFFSDGDQEVIAGDINFFLSKDRFFEVVRSTGFSATWILSGGQQHAYVLRPTATDCTAR